MLYDPKWETKTIFDLHRLIEWLEQKPPQKRYCYLDNGNCLLGQYFKFIGELPDHAKDGIGGSYAHLKSGHFELPEAWSSIAQDDMSAVQDWTFGGALSRARAFLTDKRQ